MRQMVMGNEALALGALQADVNVVTGYSGTPSTEILETGTPIIIPYTKKDIDDWATMFARCYEIAGITNMDRVHITPGYGLLTAGVRLTKDYLAEKTNLKKEMEKSNGND